MVRSLERRVSRLEESVGDYGRALLRQVERRGRLRGGGYRAPDGGQVPAVRQEDGPRPDPGNQGERPQVACNGPRAALEGSRTGGTRPSKG
jgi:hypothetical protein